MPTSFPHRRVAPIARLRTAHCRLGPCTLGHVRPIFGLETVANNTARRRAKRGEQLASVRRVRHEPAVFDMRQILANQPARSVPSAVGALTCDALDSSLLADIVVTERDELPARRYLDTEEPAPTARAWLGAATDCGLRPRKRRRTSLSLRLTDIAFRCLPFPCSCHRSSPRGVG